MKFRDIGLVAGLCGGGGLMTVGGAIMSFQPPNDPATMMIVLGLLFFVPGLVIAAATVSSWLVAKLRSGPGTQLNMLNAQMSSETVQILAVTDVQQ